MKKYRITKKGQKLWTFPNPEIVSRREVNEWNSFNIDSAVELGLLEEMPQRIELNRTENLYDISRDDGLKFSNEDHANFEHCINNEWDQIPGYLESVQALIKEWNNPPMQPDDFDVWVQDKIEALHNNCNKQQCSN